MPGPMRSYHLVLHYTTNAAKTAYEHVKLGKAADKTTQSMTRFGRSLGVLTARVFGVFAAFRAFQAITQAAIHDNFAFEKSIFAIGAMLEGETPKWAKGAESFRRNLGLSQQLMQDMEKDAARSAARLMDYVDIAQDITKPLLNIGKGMRELREMTDLTVGAATALGVEYKSAAMGIQLALTGNVRAQNRMVRLLGLQAKEFNRLDPESRYRRLRLELEKTAFANEQFRRTAVGAWTTFKDIMGITLRRGISPFFDGFKKALIGLNNLLEPLVPLLSKLLTVALALGAIRFGPTLLGITGAAGGALWGFISKALAATRLTSAGVSKKKLFRRGTLDPGALGIFARDVVRERKAELRFGFLAFIPKALTQIWRAFKSLTPILFVIASAVSLVTGFFSGFLGAMKENKVISATLNLLGSIISLIGVMFSQFFKVLNALGKILGVDLANIIRGLTNIIDGWAESINYAAGTIKRWIAQFDVFWTGVDAMFKQHGFSGLFFDESRQAMVADFKFAFRNAFNRLVLEEAGLTPAGTIVNIGEVRVVQNFEENVNPDNVAISLEEHLRRIAANPVRVHSPVR